MWFSRRILKLGHVEFALCVKDLPTYNWLLLYIRLFHESLYHSVTIKNYAREEMHIIFRLHFCFYWARICFFQAKMHNFVLACLLYHYLLIRKTKCHLIIDEVCRTKREKKKIRSQAWFLFLFMAHQRGSTKKLLEINVWKIVGASLSWCQVSSLENYIVQEDNPTTCTDVVVSTSEHLFYFCGGKWLWLDSTAIVIIGIY